MKTVYSREGDFLVYGVWQVNILLHFFLPFNYQLPIMVVPNSAKVTWLVFSKSEILNANGANGAEKMKLTAKA